MQTGDEENKTIKKLLAKYIPLYTYQIIFLSARSCQPCVYVHNPLLSLVELS